MSESERSERNQWADVLSKDPANQMARNEYEHATLRDIDSAIVQLPEDSSQRKSALSRVLIDIAQLSDDIAKAGLINKLAAIGVASKASISKRVAALAPIKPSANGHHPVQLSVPLLSEDALATRFTNRYADNWRYVSAWNKWFTFDSTHWREENTLQAFDLARQVCREAANEAQQPGRAIGIASAGTVSAVERLAKSSRACAATTEQWDRDPWLLNTTVGTLDLRTGRLSPHLRDAYMTKSAQAAPAPSSESAPLWLAFLNEITNQDKDLQAYLKRIAGYALTGVTTEHAIFFLYGTGGNGKGTFMNTLATIMGNYATTADSNMFLQSKHEPHPTGLAGLRGARLVNASEINQGCRWDEAKLKSLSGGDKISARFMHGNFFEYQPQFKLFISGNHKPAIRSVDEAMKRRLFLVPFTVKISSDRDDKNLQAKLWQERDGILAWAAEGCLEWQRAGLRPPQSVTQATDDYFETEDALGRWIEERCSLQASDTATTNELFMNWKAWADATGEFPGSMKRFATELESRGFQRWKHPQSDRKGFRGIKIVGNGEFEE